jgi:hypothetical protein
VQASPNKPTHIPKVIKCSVKLCPGFTVKDGTTNCCECYRIVHKTEECSILCRQDEDNREGNEDRKCVDCYHLSLNK